MLVLLAVLVEPRAVDVVVVLAELGADVAVAELFVGAVMVVVATVVSRQTSKAPFSHVVEFVQKGGVVVELQKRQLELSWTQAVQFAGPSHCTKVSVATQKKKTFFLLRVDHERPSVSGARECSSPVAATRTDTN
jgi:hypothetical protein